MAKKILYIDREKFLDWYFDQDIVEDFIGDHNVVTKLLIKGKFTLDINYLLNNCGYLPENLAVPGQKVVLDKQGEIDLDYYDKLVLNELEKAGVDIKIKGFKKEMVSSKFTYYGDDSDGLIVYRNKDKKEVARYDLACNMLYEDVRNEDIVWSSNRMKYNIEEMKIEIGGMK